MRVALEIAAEEDGHRERLSDDVLALRENGPLESGDILHAGAEEPRPLRQRARPDVGRLAPACASRSLVALRGSRSGLATKHGTTGDG